MIKFRLSDETKALLNNNSKISLLPEKRVKYYGSREFYYAHPALAPRNIYLYSGRITTMEEVDRSLKRIAEEPFLKRVKIFINSIFKKEK